VFQIDRHANRRDAIEKLAHSLDLFPDFFLRCCAQMPVTARNRNLHRGFSTRMSSFQPVGNSGSMNNVPAADQTGTGQPIHLRTFAPSSSPQFT
jgi:hypothetical protein